jgi:hypothetical protein
MAVFDKTTKVKTLTKDDAKWDGKFEFCTEYDYNEYRSSLAAPDWFLPDTKGRTPVSNLTTDTSFPLE